MMWDLPLFVEIDGKKYNIRNKCDYRMVLDVINALTDEELEKVYRIKCALEIFYEDLTGLTNYEKAIDEMLKIINNDEENKENDNSPALMDWEYDFKLITPPISKVLGYSVRDPKKYTHWYDFVGAYMEIPNDCIWATVIAIRVKKKKHKKLEKWEEEFCREHPEWVNLPQKYSKEEEEIFSLFEKKGV